MAELFEIGTICGSLALLHLEFRTLDVDAVLADAFGRSGLNPRQILEASEGLVLTKVDDEVVGELDTAVGGPIGGFLQVSENAREVSVRSW